MRTPDPIASDRLEDLLGGAVPEGEREALVQGLVRELRAAAPGAPPRLQARVAGLGREPRPPEPARRRWALAAAVAVVVLAAVGAGVALSDRTSSAGEEGAAAGEAASEDVAAADEAEAPDPEFSASRAGSSAGDAGRAVDVPDPSRATQVDLLVELRLRDADELSGAANGAMAIARELGGWIAGSDVDTRGREGEAELQLRIPVGRVEDAVVRLSALGTVTAQRMETVDLQAGIDRRERRLERLERAIRIGELRLQGGGLTDEERVRLELRLERLRNEATDLRRANADDRREAATAELTLLLHTREGPGAAEEDEGGAAGAARDALRLLGDVAVVVLFAVVLLAPLIVLAVLVWLLRRSRLRRAEARLLERPSPGEPSTPRA